MINLNFYCLLCLLLCFSRSLVWLMLIVGICTLGLCSKQNHGVHMSYCLDLEIPFTLPEMKDISGTDGENYKVIK